VRRALALALVLLVPACGGGGDDGPLADAERHLAEVDSGVMVLSLEASTPDGEAPIGFRVEGPFSFDSPGELAVLELTYTRVLGEEELATTVVSTGDDAWVVQDEDSIAVPEDQLGPLRVDGDHSGVPSLGLEDWAVDPEEEGGTVTAGIDAAAVLEDLRRIAADVDGEEPGDPLDDDAADRLRALVRRGELEVVTTEDGGFRSLRAVIDFGATVPDELRQALGSYAGARLTLTMSLEPLDGPLEVAPPG
jgi:hypothetical protein